MNFFTPRLLPVAIAATLSTTAWAQESVQLDNLVVSAAGTSQDAFSAPASVTVITAEQLQKTGMVDLTDALRAVPGVAVAGATDGENIFIRGLPSEYTLILVDGKRQNMRQSRTNGTGGIEQFYVPPVSAIERIEIVRGPMSSLYGSEAMGGVINIITKRSLTKWTAELTVEHTFPDDDDDGVERQHSLYLSGPVVEDALEVQLWGRRFARDESQRERGASERDLDDIKARVTWLASDNHELYVEAGQTNIESDPRLDSRDNYALGYEGDLGAWSATASLAVEDGGRDTEGSERKPEVTNSILDAKVSRPFFWKGNHDLTLGHQFMRSELSDQNPGLDDGEHYSFQNDQWALFAEDVWEISDRFALTTGLRYTDDENFGGEFTPRVYGLWTLKEGMALTAGVATGYRTPELRQSVEGYYLTTNRGRAVIAATPELDPEKSTSYELGYRYQAENQSMTATLFHTDFKNKIDSRDTGESITLNGESYDLYEYYNVGKARLQGVELTGSIALTPSLSASASYTYTDSEIQEGENTGVALSRTPEHHFSLRGDWATPVQGLTAWAATQYFGNQVNISRGEPVEYDGYTTLDLGMVYEINKHFVLKAAINNFDDVETNYDDHGTVNQGRTFWVALTSRY